jgi:hypothetical protein
MISEDNIENIDTILTSITNDEIQKMLDYGNYLYENYYEYESLSKKIIKIVNKL